MIKTSRILFLAASILLASGSFCFSNPVFYDTRSDFVAASGPLVTESLDVITTGSTVTVQPTGVTISAHGGAASSFGLFPESMAGYFSEGTASLTIQNWAPGAWASFEFDRPITGFAIDFLGHPWNGLIDFDVNVNGGTNKYTSTIDHIGGFNSYMGPLFVGVRDTTPFDTVTIHANTDNLGVQFDFLQFEPVPEPTTSLLLLTTLLLVGQSRITRRR